MLVCPQCQFENPSHNRFCQACGSPLKPLQAVLLPLPNGAVALGEEAAEVHDFRWLKDWLVGDRYLDEDHRYQLRYPPDAAQSLDTDLIVAVIDCHPGESSPLAEEENLGDAFPPTINALVTPYLELKDHLCPALPVLYAAWERQGYGTLILEDRSTWQSLGAMWEQDQPDPLEVLHWFYEMTELWEALAPWGAQASILNPANLCIDEDQILCLQRIYYGTPGKPKGKELELTQLGQCWQSLLSDCRQPELTGLQTLSAALVAGSFTHLEQVQEELAALAEQVQAMTTSAQGDDAALDSFPGEADEEPDPTFGTGVPLDSDADFNPEAADDAENIIVTSDLEPELDPELDLEMETAPLPGGIFAVEMLSDEDLMSSFDDRQDSEEGEVTHGDAEDFSDLPTMALPVRLSRLDEAGRTHVGRQRDHNEDTFFARSYTEKIDGPQGIRLNAKGLYILCDGMGGHAGGEVASALAVSTLVEYFDTHWQETLPDEAAIKDAIAAANQGIVQRNDDENRSGSGRMGTTLVLVLLQDSTLRIAHVGDSRLYGWTRRQGLRQLTVDHEVGQREIQRGVEPAIAYARPDAYQLTQALGPRDSAEVAPSIATLEVMEDIVLILCSDGLSDNDLLENYTDTHVEPLMRSTCDLEDGVIRLIDLANEHNGHDNITAVLVRLKMRPYLEAGMR